MRIRKLADGGMPAFVSFTGVNQPLPSVAATTTFSGADGSKGSSKSEAKIELLDKDMRKFLLENGLPSDVLYFLLTSEAFSDAIWSNNPRMLNHLYSLLLSILPEMRQNKKEYDDAVAYARQHNTLQEYAVTSDGGVYVVDKEGNISIKDPFKMDSGDRMLTNAYLAQMRAYYTGQAFDKGAFTYTISSSIGMGDIIKIINDLAKNVGKQTILNEQYARKDDYTRKITQGFEKILAEAEPGVYKSTVKTISADANVNAAIDYILAQLTPQQLGVLKANTVKLGLDNRKNGIKEFIALALRNQLDTITESLIDYDSQLSKEMRETTTGSGKKTGFIDEMESTPAMDFFRGLGLKEAFTMLNGNGVLYLTGNIGAISNDNGQGLGTVTLDKVAETSFAPGFDMGQVSFGTTSIDMTKQQNVVVDSNRVVGLDLPIDEQAAVLGIIRPDFKLLKRVGEIQNRIKLSGETDPAKINQLYQAAGLPSLYSGSDENGNPVLNPRYRRFAAMSAYADAAILPTDAVFDETVEKVEDETLQNSIYSILKLNKGYKPTKSGFLFWTEPELYKGTVFIPIRNNSVNYVASTKHTVAQSSMLERAEHDKLKQHNDLGITLNY